MKKLAKNLTRYRVEPKSLNLDLELLERVARMTIAEADGDHGRLKIIVSPTLNPLKLISRMRLMIFSH